MNKPVAKDAFLANTTAAERYLARFRGAPVAHLIAGVAEHGTGATFDDLSPVDNSVIAKVAAGGAAEIDKAAKAAMAAFPAWAALDGDKRRAILHAIADRIEARADEIALVESSDTGQADPLHVEGRVARCREFPVLRRSRPFGARRPLAADADASELHDARADRPGRRDHAVEHALHALDLEDRAGARGGLHRRPQARGMEPAHGGASRRDHERGDHRGGAAGRASSIACMGSAKRPARR